MASLDFESIEKTFKPFLTSCIKKNQRHAFEFIVSKDAVDLERLEAFIDNFSELTFDCKKLHLVCFEVDKKEIKKTVSKKFTNWSNFHIVKI